MKNTKNNFAVLVRSLLIFGGIYLFAEGVIHLFAIRLLNTIPIWPESATLYATWMGRFYGSFTLLVAILLFYIQRDIRKHQTLLRITAGFAVFHGCLLMFAAVVEPFDVVYGPYPSLSFWIPQYSAYISFEAILLILYALIIYVWSKETKS